MDDQSVNNDLSIVGVWLVRAIALAVTILAAAGVLGLAWRVFNLLAW